jgi:hypothetical protein
MAPEPELGEPQFAAHAVTEPIVRGTHASFSISASHDTDLWRVRDIDDCVYYDRVMLLQSVSRLSHHSFFVFEAG